MFDCSDSSIFCRFSKVRQSAGRFGKATSLSNFNRSFFAILEIENLVDQTYSSLQHSPSLSPLLEIVTESDEESRDNESSESLRWSIISVSMKAVSVTGTTSTSV